MSSKFDLVINNGVVVTASETGSYSIGIRDGKIHTLAPSFTDEEAAGAEIVDAQGAYVMPGGIDAHVHLSQHGKTGRNADDFESGSRSALAGGTTTMIAFVNQRRDESDRSMLKLVSEYSAVAESTGSYVDYGFHMIIVRNDADVLEAEFPVLVKEWGITSCKLYMTYDALKLTDWQLLDVMSAARKTGIMTMIHAENADMIEWLTDRLEAQGKVAPYYHAFSHPPVAEGEATYRAIALAELVQNPILFVHVGSSAGAMNIRIAQTRGLPVYAETCPQYLNLTWDDLKRFHSPTCFENSKMICSPPPPPDDSDRENLYLGLHNGTFTIFSSDHCPYKYDDPHGKALGVLEHPASMEGEDPTCKGKELSELLTRKTGAFKFIPNGIPGIETRLPLLYTGGLATGKISPEKFVELTSTNPAKLYGMYPQKGALLPGSDADLVIWYPDATFTPFHLQNSRLHHNVDYTPYEGQKFTNWPRYTILRGKVAWAEGEIRGKVRDGRYLKRGLSQMSKGVPGRKDARNVAGWLYE